MKYNLLSGIFKLAVASLAVGYALSAADLSAYQILAEVGLTPEQIVDKAIAGVAWAIPHIILGAMVILPVWFVVSIFSPPRSGGRE